MRRVLPRLLFAVETVLLTILVVVGVQTFVVQPYRVEHGSMLGTLQDGEMVLVDKLSPRLGWLRRGDIIVFEPPPRVGDPGTPFIKRVIGMPGDRVSIRDGVVIVNGLALDESRYVYQGQPTLPMEQRAEWQVPAGSLFVLGDHRVDSTDSRTTWLGMVPVDRVIGRAAIRYWPLEAAAPLDAPGYPELGGRSADQAGAIQGSMARR